MMYFDPERGWVNTMPGTDSEYGINSPEERQRQADYYADQEAFLASIAYDPNYDYSGEYGGLFGADHGGNYYYSGPNDTWGHALSDRLRHREQGDYDERGRYESATMTMDRELQEQMARRNNVIESMYRQGYSRAQIADHMAGRRNVLEDGPDWADYNKEYREWYATNLEGNPLTGGGPTGEFWGDDYFIGAPDRGNPAPQNPLLGGGSSSGGGLLDAYYNARGMENPMDFLPEGDIFPTQDRRPSNPMDTMDDKRAQEQEPVPVGGRALRKSLFREMREF